MDSHIISLKQYLSETDRGDKVDNGESLLEQMWYFHSNYCPFNSDIISNYFDALTHELKNLSKKRQRKVKRIVAELCEEHDRLAYIEGICTGFKLVQEIDKILRDVEERKEEADYHAT